MPTAFDPPGRVPLADKDPLANLLNFQDISTTALSAGGAIKLAMEQLLDTVVDVIKELTGIDLSGFVDFISDLFGGIDLKDPASLNPADIIANFIQAMLKPNGLPEAVIEVVTDMAINALNIFGNLPEYLLGSIPAGSISGVQPNLLSNPEFEGAVSLSGGGGWVWDSTVGRTTVGAAKAVADGTDLAIHSNAVLVQPGQTLDVSAWVLTDSYAGAGTPISLAVKTFYQGSVVDTTIIDSTGAAAAWSELAGTFTVPSGVDSLRLRPVVGAGMTAGSAWFDDAALRKQGYGPFDGILELFGLSVLDDLIGLDPTGVWSWVVQNAINPLGLLDETGVPVISDLIQAIIGLAGGVTEVQNFFNDLIALLGGPTDIGSGSPVVDETSRVPIVGGLLNGLYEGFMNLFGLDVTQTQVAEAAASVGSSLTGQAAALAQLQAALAPGTPDSDDFERTNSGNWGANWQVMEDGNGGNAEVDGHNAVWEADYGENSEVVCRKLDVQASTDNQTVSVVLGSATMSVTSGNSATDLWLRMSNFTTWATRTGARLRFWGDKSWQLHWFNSGAGTLLASGSHNKSMGSGATLSFEAGQGLTPRRFIAKINSEPIMDTTEAGTTSQYGASYRFRGGGGRGEFAVVMLPPIEINPGKWKQWTASG